MKQFILASFFISNAALANVAYQLDKAHTEIGFQVKHLMISNVKGRFDKFEGGFNYDDKAKTVSDVEVKIEMSSIDTNDKDRDKHLSSPDFFDVQNHPTMIFKAEKIQNVVPGKKFKVPGTLTIRGKTQKVALDGDFHGVTVDPWGNERIVFGATTKINRNDWGITWNKKLDKGGVVVGDEVTIVIEAEALKAKK